MSKRTAQVASLLCQYINSALMKDFEAPANTLVSVSRVDITPDLKEATAYVSVIPSNHWGSALQAIKSYQNQIARSVARQLKMKFTPHIRWQIDDTDFKYSQIDEALKN